MHTTGTVVEPYPSLDPAHAVDEEYGLGLHSGGKVREACQSAVATSMSGLTSALVGSRASASLAMP